MIDRIKEIVLRTKQRPRFLIDELKHYFISITKFFEYVAAPLIGSIQPFRDIDVSSSYRYNSFLESAENDINLIYGIQQEINNNMLASWNVVENSYPEEIQPPSPYDEDFILEHDNASVISDRITLGVKSFSSAIPQIKGKPILAAESSDKNIPVYYGKAWGMFVPGNESGEDGIRAQNNDGSVITDEKDTFWEAEAVVVQEERENTKFLQPVFDKDISLSTSVKIIFQEPTSINTITVRPYNAAASAYYKLVKVEASDGTLVVPLDIEETFIMTETIFIFDTPDKLQDRKIRSLTLTFRQDTGYYMKYTLGYFKIKNTESWVDVTGSHVAEDAKKLGGNFNSNVSYLIENADKWILSYWLPGVTFTETPKRILTKGENGFLLVPSTESKRKRYTIGITDIIIGQNEYFDTAEKVTNEIDIPEGKTTISISAEDQGDVLYFMSFDNGMSWNKILPMGKQDERGDDLRLVPKKLHINSDLSLQRRKNTDTGEAAFIYTASKKIRVRFVLKRDPITNILPSVFNWDLKWGKE